MGWVGLGLVGSGLEIENGGNYTKTPSSFPSGAWERHNDIGGRQGGIYFWRGDAL